MHMSEDQFRAFFRPISEPYLEKGGVSKIILSKHRSGYFEFGKKAPYTWLTRSWWYPGSESKQTFLSGKSGRLGHVAISQLGIFQLRDTQMKSGRIPLDKNRPFDIDKDCLKLVGIVSVDESTCDLSEPSRFGETMSKISGYQCHSIYELHPMARDYHTSRQRSKQSKDIDASKSSTRCPCRVAGWIVEVYFASREFDTQGVCRAANQFYQTYSKWKFAFHKDQDQLTRDGTTTEPAQTETSFFEVECRSL